MNAPVDATHDGGVRFEPGAPMIEGVHAWTRLGSGRFCESWMAWSVIHGRPVVVKLPLVDAPVERARRVLRREATHLRMINHPAYQRLLGGALDDGDPFLVLEYVEGPTLQTILENEGTVAERDALNIATELVAAVGFLHRLGLAHMDLNPTNVILRDGRVVVMDLGLVFPLGAAVPDGYPRGTQGYMAPEQWLGAPCSAAMDLFSVGCMLYELLVGEAPYDFEGPPAAPLPSLRRPFGRRQRRQTLDSLLSQLAQLDPNHRSAAAEDALLILGGIRRIADRPWPAYVDALLTSPVTGRPAWTEVPQSSLTGPTAV